MLSACLGWESLTYIPRKDCCIVKGDIHFCTWLFWHFVVCVIHSKWIDAFWSGEPIFWVINQPESLAPGESQLCWLSCLPTKLENRWSSSQGVWAAEDLILEIGEGSSTCHLKRRKKDYKHKSHLVAQTWISPGSVKMCAGMLYTSFFMYLKEESFDNLRNCTNKCTY